MRTQARWRLVGAGLIAVGIAAAYLRLAPSRTADAAYVGADACQPCHRDAYDRWRASQHRQAMLPADAESVRGDFNNTTFTYAGVTSTFRRRDGGFLVRTDGPDGALADFAVKYTFGVFPLQQYLIELAGGRLQALAIAWDTRPREAGGQRWFHLYPGERIDHSDELHWTGRQQNWNYMCADCHSTGVRKGYDAATDTFRTTWADLTVACEACHGPGSRHTAWAEMSPWLRRLWRVDDGLTVHLNERRGVAWTATRSPPIRSVPRTSSAEIQICATCHSRRSQLGDGYVAGAPFDDFYVAATLDTPLYYPDGQQRDEVYVYGSFLQSRMQHAGVTCGDCHEPHGARLRAPGNALCTTCHPAARYDGPAHHFHTTGTVAAACTSCHMPARTYMQIDSRRDHGFRVPRPDLTVSTGASNACNACHTTQTAAWAAAKIRERYGHDASGFQDFAAAFHAADEGHPGAAASLIPIATGSGEPSIVRASALIRLAAAPTRPAIEAARTSLKDPDPMVRRAALRVFGTIAPAERAAFLIPMLADPSRSVRVETARLLAPSSASMSGDERARFDRVAAELVAAEGFNADRPEHRTSLGTFLIDIGKGREGADQYRAALRLRPTFVPAYVNLADASRGQGDEPGAERTLRDGLARVPSSAELHYALGLSLARSHKTADATAALKKAADLAPDEARFAYAYAVALGSAGEAAAAIRVLVSALRSHPDDRDVLFGLAAFERDAGQLPAARNHAARLLARYPEDPDARALAQALGVAER